MKFVAPAITVALAVCASSNAQAPAKLEFEAVSIKAAAPSTGHFRFASPSSASGGPGTADPALFRCTNCNVGFLMSKAFELQRYQFPGQTSLPETAYDILARVPEGATAEQFQVMLQTLLKDRFGLAYHNEKKQLQGYELVVAKGGHKLKESRHEPAKPASGEGGWHGGGGSGHAGNGGAMMFHGQGTYRGDHQTMSDIVRVISTQLAKPVDDRTGLTGKYDVALTWVDDGAPKDGGHAPGGVGGGGEWNHGGGGGAGTPQNSGGAFSGPTLPGAVQAQLGLKLEPTKATANVFVVDHVDKAPTEN